MTELWWYTARASGIVAWGLLATGVLWGLALSTRALGARPRPSWLLDLHRFLGGAAVVFTGVHIASLVADSYVHFGLVEVLVPLASRWHPVAVAWGVVSVYLLVAVELTSLLRRHLPRRLWRLVHLASFPLFTVATIHLLAAGTDRGNLALRLTVLGVAAAVAGLTLLRLAAQRPLPAAPPAPSATSETPSAGAPPPSPGGPTPRPGARGPVPAPLDANRPVAWPSAPPSAPAARSPVGAAPPGPAVGAGPPRR